MGLEKAYSGTITLGATTPSYDLETEIDQNFPIEDLTTKEIEEAVISMNGDYDQFPPIFSAKKVNGKKAYDLARAGKEVELKSKKISIHQFDISNLNLPELNFYIRCSKGTYIRSIAYDLGVKLNNGGHLSSLRREAIGTYNLSNANSVDEWIEIIQNSEVYNN